MTARCRPHADQGWLVDESRKPRADSWSFGGTVWAFETTAAVALLGSEGR